MPKYKNSFIFLGPSYCENCSGYTIKRLYVDKRFHAGVFLATLIPIFSKKQLIICDCCQQTRKPNDYEKKLIDFSKKNGLDNELAEERFILEVENTLIKFKAYDENGYDLNGIKNAADYLFDKYSTKYDYEYSFYSYLCEIYAITNSDKLRKRKLKYQ